MTREISAADLAEVEQRVQDELSVVDAAPVVQPSYWQRFGSSGGIYSPDDVITKRGWEIYDEIIRRDPRAATYMRFLKFALVSGGWEVVPGDRTPEAESRAETMRELIDQRYVGDWTDVPYKIASALHNGVSVNEKIHEVVPDGPLRGKVALREFKDRNPAHFNYDQDKFGRLLDDGLVQFWQQGRDEIRHNVADFVIWSHDSEYDNIYGRSMFQPIYEAYFARRVLPRQANVAIDKFGTGALVIRVPRGTTLAVKEAILARARKVHGSSIYVCEEGETWENTPFPLQGFDSIVKWLERYDQEMAIGLAVPSLLFTAGSVGSYALSDVQLEVALVLYRRYQLAFDEAISESIFRPIDEANYGPGPHPRHKLRAIDIGGIKAAIRKWEALRATNRRPTIQAQANELGMREEDIEEAAAAPSTASQRPGGAQEDDTSEGEDDAGSLRKARVGEGEDEEADMSEFGRELTRHERRVDFSSIDAAYKANAESSVAALRAAVSAEVGRIGASIRKESADGRRPLRPRR